MTLSYTTQPSLLQRIKPFFWNGDENRLRAAWRILAQLAVLAILVGLSTLLFSLLRDGLIKPLLWSSLIVRLITKLIEVNLTWLCIIASLVLAGRFFDKQPLRSFGFALTRPWWRDFGFGLGLGALLMALIFGVEYLLGWVSITGFFETNGASFSANIILFVGQFIAVGIQEETLTRGYWLRNLAEGFNFRRFGPRTALFIGYGLTSILFGLLHLGNPNTSWVSTLNLVLAGLLFGLPYLLTGDLALPIGLHIAWNFFQGNVFGLPVSGSAPGTSFIAVQQAGPDLWTGGAFGPEAGLVGLAAMLIGAGLMVLWLRTTHGPLAWQTRLAVYPPAAGAEETNALPRTE